MTHRDASTHKNEDGFSPMEIKGVTYTDKKSAGNAILACCQAMTSPDAVPLGQYRGFAMSLSFDSFAKAYVITMKNELTHTTHLGTDVFGNIQRMDNALNSLPHRKEREEAQQHLPNNAHDACLAAAGAAPIRVCVTRMIPRIEMLLRDILPPEACSDFCHRIVYHGRAVCNARAPRCEECCVKHVCQHYEKEKGTT